MTVATAPSMDGYASGNSSMISAGIKVTRPCMSDGNHWGFDVICQAPMNMLRQACDMLQSMLVSANGESLTSLMMSTIAGISLLWFAVH